MRLKLKFNKIADPIAAITAVFEEQIKSLNDFISAKQEEVNTSAVVIAEAHEKIDANMAEIDRAASIKANIESIVGKA